MYPIKANKLRCTSKYGNRQYTYQGRLIKDFHRGVDLVAEPNNRNEEILAFEDGVVTSVQKTGKQYGTGCYVRIKHSNGYYTLYYHLKSGSIVVNKGDKVKRGQKIAVIGTTGQSTGVHLHFQIDKGSSSTSINPYDYVFNNKQFISNNTKPSGNKKLYLPKDAVSWRVYKMGTKPVKGNECGFLKPSKFGGLTYDILGYTSSNVAIIQTRDYGKVQIYIAPSTGAVIK